MKKIAIGLAMFVGLSFVLPMSACKDRSVSDPETLTVAVSPDPVEQTIIKTFIKAYQEQPGNENKKIQIVSISDNYDNWVNQQLYVDRMSDVIQVYDYKAEYWTNQGLLAPISDYMDRDGLSEDDYFASVIEMTKSKAGEDNMYWVPRDYNKVVVVYNTKMFELAGIDPPEDDWTFSDFREVCVKLQNAKPAITEYSGLENFWPANMNLDWAAVYYPVIKSYGGELIDVENSKAFKNPDAVKQGINMLCSYADDALSVSYIDTMDPGSAFANKQCAMMFTARPNIPEYYDSLDGEIDFVSFPRIEGTEMSYIGMGCTGYGMTQSCPDSKKEFAWDFLKFIISEKGQEAFCVSGSGIPVLKSLAESETAAFRTVYPGLNNDAFVSQAERDLPMTYMKGFKPDKQLGIYSYLINNFLSTFYKSSGAEREARYDTVAEKLEELFNS